MKMTTFPDKAAPQEQNRTQPSQTGRDAKSLQRRQTLMIAAGRILLVICLLIVWQLLSGSLVDPLLISSPLAVGSQLVAWISDGTLRFHTSITIE